MIWDLVFWTGAYIAVVLTLGSVIGAVVHHGDNSGRHPRRRNDR